LILAALGTDYLSPTEVTDEALRRRLQESEKTIMAIDA
jgi:hypothetical protein